MSLAEQKYFVNRIGVSESNFILAEVYPLSLERISSAMDIHRHKVLRYISWFYKFVLHTVLCG